MRPELKSVAVSESEEYRQPHDLENELSKVATQALTDANHQVRMESRELALINRALIDGRTKHKGAIANLLIFTGAGFVVGSLMRFAFPPRKNQS